MRTSSGRAYIGLGLATTCLEGSRGSTRLNQFELPPSGPPGLRARQQATRPRVVVKPTSERIRAMHAQCAPRVQRWLHRRPTCVSVTGRRRDQPDSHRARVSTSCSRAKKKLAELFEVRWSSTLCIAALSLYPSCTAEMTAVQQCFT